MQVHLELAAILAAPELAGPHLIWYGAPEKYENKIGSVSDMGLSPKTIFGFGFGDFFGSPNLTQK